MRAVALLLGALSSVVGAQQVHAPVGARVRIETRAPGRTVVGTFVSQTSDSVTVFTRQAPQTVVSSASITRIRVSEGRSHRSGARRGVKIGTVIGVVTGLVILGAGVMEDGGDRSLTPGGVAAGLGIWVLSGAATGAMYGTLIGGAIGAERWRTTYSR